MTTFGGQTPSSDSQPNIVYRVQEWSYGNGYKAYVPDGANATLYNAQVNFDYLSGAKWTAFQTWMNANPPWVTWTGDGQLLPSSLTFRTTKDGYQVTTLPGGVYQIQFDCEQVF